MNFDINCLDKNDCMIAIKNEHRPIFVYGMGNGALKIMQAFENFNIKIEGFFASDEFARNHSFCGYPVQRLSEVEQKYSDFVIVLAFAAGYEPLISKIRGLAEKYTLYAPDVPLFFEGEMQLFDYSYAVANFDKLKAVFDMLCDEKSKQLFIDTINFKITGNIDYLFKNFDESDDEYKVLNLDENEVFVDCGAYKGDTVADFLAHTNGEYSHIYAVEPDVKNYKKLLEKFGSFENCELINAAIYSCDTKVCFANKMGRQSSIDKAGIEIDARSVDSILQGNAPSYIKYDIEGAEKQALSGSKNAIAQHKPKLLVSVYHRNEDIFELPIYINEINSGYKMYLRRRKYIPAWDTNLICI